MARRSRLLKTLSILLPAGALGASIALATAPAQASTGTTADIVSLSAPDAGVAARLAAIRTAFSEIAGSLGTKPVVEGETQLAWWGNGGWGRWHFGWGNGGWGNGGWHNWGNGWHNWGNGGWHNWGNGWHNFWHNW